MAFPVAVQVKMELDVEIHRLGQDLKLASARGPFRRKVTRRDSTCIAFVVDRYGRRVDEVAEKEYSAFAP